MNRGISSTGLAGRIARAFLHSQLTPLMIVASLLVGLVAAFTLPREEEPQIKVPMIDIRLAWPGRSVEEVERQLTTPVERRLSQVPGLEYVYSTTRDDGALLIARFVVGSSPEDALVRIRTRLDEAAAGFPQGARVEAVSPRSIDDVPVLALNLWSPKRPGIVQDDLRRVASEFAVELRKEPGVALVEIVGGQDREVRVAPDPTRMAAAGVTVDRLTAALAGAGLSLPAGSEGRAGVARELRVESPLRTAAEIRSLAIRAPGQRPLRLSELATVTDGPSEPANYVFFGGKDGARHPAVTIEVSKLPGVNATSLTHALHARAKDLQARLLGRDITVTTTRDYGVSAKHKSDDLMFHLLLATLSVILLIAFALGRREAVVVAVAIPVTLALTLFVYRFFGYTLNRVTLFALIFSIGILVDDAIVVVENIARHFHMDDARSPDQRAVEAVDEVGNPTVLATFAVIAAILPLAFVGGLMGPYMKPIPVGASVAMLFSLGVALIVTPWAARAVLKIRASSDGHGENVPSGRMDTLYRDVMRRLLTDRKARAGFFAVMLLFFAGAASLMAFRMVTVKMLPFDNKSEFEVLVDMPPGTPLEGTLAVADELGVRLAGLPEVKNFQVYAGAGAPITFNGLVRHYDMRTEPRFADIQVNLVDAADRRRQSHAIARGVRPELEASASRHGARIKVVEVPPGPPVLSTLVAEVYGPSLQGQRALAHQVWGVFKSNRGVVDSDLLLAEDGPRTRLEVDRERSALAGISAAEVTDAVSTLYAGRIAGALNAPEEAEPVPVRIRLAPSDRADLSALGALRIGPGAGTPISELTGAVSDSAPAEIYHKNGHRVVYVLGDVAGKVESPVYAIADLKPGLDSLVAPDGGRVDQLNTHLPLSDEHYSVKWDGEWHITYEVFRDMGAAFAVVLVLIYILTVGWFKSFYTPFVIMLPIPLSLVGILPAHALLGAFFTATSMIGFIAGAGISVRNSIILVDFIELRRSQGHPLLESVIDAGAVRFRPMVLTAAAVCVGAGVILFDPIFQGLAVALIGGEIAATLLSRVTIPVLYYLLQRRVELRAALRGTTAARP